ncbi:MAG: alkaline phosphatase family protein [Pseudomonadota bacterium]
MNFTAHHLPSTRGLLLAVITAAGLATAQAQAASAATPAAKPKLVVVLVVDGLPYEQVVRYRHQFGQGGFRRLLEQGASFNDAHQAHGMTLTAVGHAAILTGAYPNRHGIIGNNWIDAKTGKQVYCTDDINHTYIGEKTDKDDGTSPARLRVPTLGDELRYASGNRAKVLTVSGKDRGAILLAGKTGTAYMYMEESGNFASSSYYMKSHPGWVSSFAAGKPQDRYYGKSWTPMLDEAAYVGDSPEIPNPKPDTVSNFPIKYDSKDGKPDAGYYRRLKLGPYVDELTLDFARAAVVGENLGKNPAGVPDLLGISLSSHDYVNHSFGPESKMSHDHLQQVDRMLAGFFGFLDKRIGMDNVLVVLTADHGFANVPEYTQARGIDAARLEGGKLGEGLAAHLAQKFAVEGLMRKASMPTVFFDYELAERRNIKRADLEDAAARYVLAQPGVDEVFTRTQLEAGNTGATRVGQLMQRAWHRQLSGDLLVVIKPNWIFSYGSGGTSHGTPHAYDTNVPLILMGQRWIAPGSYGEYAETVDIAPTLSHLLELRKPSASVGRVLTEVLRQSVRAR